MKLLISPHDDDSVLFTAFTCIREKPIVCVVTDSYKQPLRGEIGCSAHERAQETKKACEILGCPVIRLHIPDNACTEEDVIEAIGGFAGFDTVYAPALQGGNMDHDAVSRAATQVFGNVRYYTTYAPGRLYTTGKEEIIPTDEEQNIKYRALECYQSQIRLDATRPHFEAIIGKPEWLN